jgi:hypothetical protein
VYVWEIILKCIQNTEALKKKRRGILVLRDFKSCYLVLVITECAVGTMINIQTERKQRHPSVYEKLEYKTWMLNLLFNI